jgi:CheY-like chemotaxis protein
MARKSALVVDDSKSARVILSRMLEKYDIEVDMAESAEQAIEYLNANRPDAIFMDHLMPGMDGLQAVQAIKSNPKTATIPIMMYTSQEGELYVGQARALGAMGVLPKQVRPVDVSKVLYELHLLPDRRETAEPALAPVELDGSGTVTPLPTVAHIGDAKSANLDWGRRIEASLREQSADLRRFVVASLDGVATRIVADLSQGPVVAAPDVTVPPPRARTWPWVTSLLVVFSIAAACAVLWSLTRDELARTRAQLKRSGEQLSGAVKDLTAALAASTATLSAAAPAVASPARVEPVPYGEIPFDRGRLDALRDFVSKLQGQGFHGTVKITSAAGLYCLAGNPVDGFLPAAAALPANKCDLVGNPFDDSLSPQQRQSVDFANLIASIRQRTAGAITVVMENAGSTRPAVPYPQRSESLTAGEWNRAAAYNNRVEFAAEALAP